MGLNNLYLQKKKGIFYEKMHEQLHFKIEQEYYKIFITMEKRRY